MATSKKSKAKPKAKATAKAATAKPKQGNEALRNLFLAGIGLADETNTKLHKTFTDLVKKGKTKEPEVKRAVEEIRKKAMARGKELEKKFQDFVKKNDLESAKKELLKKRDELMKSKEVKDLKKKYQDFVKKNNLEKTKKELLKKKNELMKSKEVKDLRKKIQSLQEQIKSAAQKVMAPKAEAPEVSNVYVTPSSSGVTVNTPVAEETPSTQG